jgi:hypothetical protein
MSELEIMPLKPIQAPREEIKRTIAHLIREAGKGDLFVEAMAKNMPYQNYLAIMLWDAVTEGEFLLADGRKIQISEFKDWLDLVKFMAQHVDGPAIIENNFVGINVYKIYQGIDEDKV